MIERLVLGEVPKKHHIVFRDASGNLRYEECLTRQGFDGPYTIMYHARRPHTQRFKDVPHGWQIPSEAPPQRLGKRHYKTQDLAHIKGSALDTRTPLLFNSDVVTGVVKPTEADPVYFVNGDADDLFYIFKGGGTLRTMLGDLKFVQDDYVYVPKGVLHRFIPDNTEQYWFSIECLGGAHLPKQWRNEVGQLRMDAPFCHRDFRLPTFTGPQDEGLRDVVVKCNNQFSGFTYQDPPLDVVGYDGTVYPFAFPILNFQPRAGLVHLPPDWHGTFATRGALICSFVPRKVDFHPEAIPCPYPHSSVDCDEILFYARGNFTSRKGVGPGSISHHPAGIAHGPHPGAYEESIGTKETNELAVMLDLFKPLQATQAALRLEDRTYQDSFLG
jgi:homogentisate 1,2-dioxygenase